MTTIDKVLLLGALAIGAAAVWRLRSSAPARAAATAGPTAPVSLAAIAFGLGAGDGNRQDVPGSATNPYPYDRTHTGRPAIK